MSSCNSDNISGTVSEISVASFMSHGAISVYSDIDQPCECPQQCCLPNKLSLDQYDDLPANAEERKMYFIDKYKKLISNIWVQISLIHELRKKIGQELKTKHNVNLIDQLKELITNEEKVTNNLIGNAKRIQRFYPHEKWEPIPKININCPVDNCLSLIDNKNGNMELCLSKLSDMGNDKSISTENGEKAIAHIPQKSSEHRKRGSLHLLSEKSSKMSSLAYCKYGSKRMDPFHEENKKDLLHETGSSNSSLSSMFQMSKKIKLSRVTLKSKKSQDDNNRFKGDFDAFVNSKNLEISKFKQKYLKAKEKITKLKSKLKKYDTTNYINGMGSKLISPRIKQSLEKTKNCEQDEFKRVCDEKQYYVRNFEKLKRENQELLIKIGPLNYEVKMYKKLNGKLRLEHDKFESEIENLKSYCEHLQNECERKLLKIKNLTTIQQRTYEKKIYELKTDLFQCKTSTCRSLQLKDKEICDMQYQLAIRNFNFDENRSLDSDA